VAYGIVFKLKGNKSNKAGWCYQPIFLWHRRLPRSVQGSGFVAAKAKEKGSFLNTRKYTNTQY
jgi:hypothetical protein